MAGRIAYYGNIVRDGLIVNLDAGKVDSYPGSGTLWRDITWNNRNGTLTNFGPSSFYSKDDSGYLLFDGTNDYANLGDIFVLNDSIPKTFNIWFNLSTIKTNSLIADMGGSANRGWWLYTSVGNQIVFGGSDNGSDARLQYRTTTNANLVANTWYHLCLVYNPLTPTVLFYLNGNLLTDNNNIIYSSYFSSTTFIQVGAYAGAIPNQPLSGRLSQILVYNKALTQAEVTRNYNALRGRYNL